MNKKRKKILILDDEVGIRELLSEILTDEGYSTIALENADKAWKARVEESPSLVLLDIWMPGLDGITLLKQWKAAGLDDVPVIIMSGHATIDTAVEAMKLGAREVLEKPIAVNRLLAAVQGALNHPQSDERFSPTIRQENFGKSAPMKKLKNDLLAASSDNSPTLFLGAYDSGVFFFTQHLCPPKKNMVMIDNNKQLEGDIKSILHQVNGGGIIVARNMSYMTQVQQNGLLGLSHEAARMSIRVIACSVEPLEALQNNANFNENLINLFSRRLVEVPSLSKCMEDLPEIIMLVLKKLTVHTSMEGTFLTPSAINLLHQHKYENDFSELMSALRSAVMFAEGGKITDSVMYMVLDQLSRNSSSHGIPAKVFTMNLREAREVFECEYFRNLIQMMRGNMQQAAQTAGLERTYFYRKLKQYKGN